MREGCGPSCTTLHPRIAWTGRRAVRHVTDHHDRNVVDGAARKREFDESIAAVLWRRRHHLFEDFIVLHVCRQTVAAEHEYVAGAQCAVAKLELGIFVDPDGPRDDVPARSVARLV